MMFAFRGQIGLMRFFRRIKPANNGLYAVSANSRAPSFATFKFRYTQKPSGFIACMRPFLVLNVFCCRNIAKIAKSIIPGIAVNVVNVAGRPDSNHVKPCQPTGSISSFVNSDNCVSFRLGISSNRPWNNFAARFHTPSKDTCFGIVVQQCTQLVKCNVKMAHAISLS